MGYYHVCSDGNSAAVLFGNEADFKAAMNRVAICATGFPVTILAFVLMGNHFHFVMRCDSEDTCRAFISEFKRLTGRYNSMMNRESTSLSNIEVKVIPVTDIDYLRTLVCYVLKNPTKARLDMFYNYPWGSGDVYFKSKMSYKRLVYRRVSDFPLDTVRKMFNTRRLLPGQWVVCDGIILPRNYVAGKEVEDLYKTPLSFMYHLSLNNDKLIEEDMGDWCSIKMNDVELREARDTLMVKTFRKSRVRDLSAQERISLAKMLKQQYHCSKKQLSRIVLLPFDTISRLL